MPTMEEIALSVLKSKVEIVLLNAETGEVLRKIEDSNTDTIWAKLHTPVSGTLKLDMVADEPIDKRLGGALSAVRKTCFNQANALRSNLLDVAFTHDSNAKQYYVNFNWTNTGTEPRQIYGLVAYVGDNVYTTYVFDPPLEVAPSVVVIGRYIIEYSAVTPNFSTGSNMTVATLQDTNAFVGVFPVLDPGIRQYKLTRGTVKSSEYFGIDISDTDVASSVLYTYTNTDTTYSRTFPTYRISGELRWQILVSGSLGGAIAVRKFYTGSISGRTAQIWEYSNYYANRSATFYSGDIYIDGGVLLQKVRQLRSQLFSTSNEYERYTYKIHAWQLLEGGQVKPFKITFPTDSFTTDTNLGWYGSYNLRTPTPWLKVYGPSDAGYFIAYLYWNNSPTFNVRFYSPTSDYPTQVDLYINGTKYSGTISHPASGITEVTFDLSGLSAGHGVVVLKVYPVGRLARIGFGNTTWYNSGWQLDIRSDFWGYVLPYAGSLKDGSTFTGGWINSAFFNLNGTDTALDDVGSLSDSDIANLGLVTGTPLTHLDEINWPFWVWVQAGDLNNVAGELDPSKPIFVFSQCASRYNSDYTVQFKIPVYNAQTQTFMYGDYGLRAEDYHNRVTALHSDNSLIYWLLSPPDFENDYVKKDWLNRELVIKREIAYRSATSDNRTYWVVRRQGETDYRYLVPDQISDYTIGDASKVYGGVTYEFETTIMADETIGATTFHFESSSVFDDGEFFGVPIADAFNIVPIDALEKWNLAYVDYSMDSSLESIQPFYVCGSDDFFGDFSQAETSPAINFITAPAVQQVTEIELPNDITIGDATHRAIFEVTNQKQYLLHIPKVINVGGIDHYVDIRSLVLTDGIRLFGWHVDPLYMSEATPAHAALQRGFWSVVVNEDDLKRISTTDVVSFKLYAYFKAVPADELFPMDIEVKYYGKEDLSEGTVVKIHFPFAVPDTIYVTDDQGNSLDFTLLDPIFYPASGNTGCQLYVKLPALAGAAYSHVGIPAFTPMYGVKLDTSVGYYYSGSPQGWTVSRSRLHGGFVNVPKRCLNPEDGKPYLESWLPTATVASKVKIRISNGGSSSFTDPAAFFPLYVTAENTSGLNYYGSVTGHEVDGVLVKIDVDDEGSMEAVAAERCSIFEMLAYGRNNVWFWSEYVTGAIGAPRGDVHFDFNASAVSYLTNYLVYDRFAYAGVFSPALHGQNELGQSWLGYNTTWNNVYFYQKASFIALLGYRGHYAFEHDLSTIPCFSSYQSIRWLPTESPAFQFPYGEIETVSGDKKLFITDMSLADRNVGALSIPLKELDNSTFRCFTFGGDASQIEWMYPVMEDKGLVSPLSAPDDPYYVLIPQVRMYNPDDPALHGIVIDDPDFISAYSAGDVYVYNGQVGWIASADFDSSDPMYTKYRPNIMSSGDYLVIYNGMLVGHIRGTFITKVIHHFSYDDGIYFEQRNRTINNIPGWYKSRHVISSYKEPAWQYTGWWYKLHTNAYLSIGPIDVGASYVYGLDYGSRAVRTDFVKLGLGRRPFNVGFLNKSFLGSEISAFGHGSIWAYTFPSDNVLVCPVVEIEDLNTSEVRVFGIRRGTLRVVDITDYVGNVSDNNARRLYSVVSDVKTFAPFSSLLSSYGTSDYRFRIGVLCVADVQYYDKLAMHRTSIITTGCFGGSHEGVVGVDTTTGSIPNFLNGCLFFQCRASDYSTIYLFSPTMFYGTVRALHGLQKTSASVYGGDLYIGVPSVEFSEYRTYTRPFTAVYIPVALGNVYYGTVGLTGISAQLACSDATLTDVEFCFRHSVIQVVTNNVADITSDSSSVYVKVYNPNDTNVISVVKIDLSSYDLSTFSNGVVCYKDGAPVATIYEADDKTCTNDFSRFNNILYIRAAFDPGTTVLELRDETNTYEPSDVFNFYDDFTGLELWETLGTGPSVSFSPAEHDGGTGAESWTERGVMFNSNHSVQLTDKGLALQPYGQGTGELPAVKTVNTFSRDLIWEIVADDVGDRLLAIFGDCSVNKVFVPTTPYYHPDGSKGILLRPQYKPIPSVKYKLTAYTCTEQTISYSGFHAGYICGIDKHGAFRCSDVFVYYTGNYDASALIGNSLPIAFFHDGAASEQDSAYQIMSTTDRSYFIRYRHHVYNEYYESSSSVKLRFSGSIRCFGLITSTNLHVYNGSWYSTTLTVPVDTYFSGVIYKDVYNWYINELANITIFVGCVNNSFIYNISTLSESGTLFGYTYDSRIDIEISFSDSSTDSIFVPIGDVVPENLLLTTSGDSIFSPINVTALSGVVCGQSAHCAYIMNSSPQDITMQAWKIGPVSALNKLVSVSDTTSDQRQVPYSHIMNYSLTNGYANSTYVVDGGTSKSRGGCNYVFRTGTVACDAPFLARAGYNYHGHGTVVRPYNLACTDAIACGWDVDNGSKFVTVNTRKTSASAKVISNEVLYKIAIKNDGTMTFTISSKDGYPLKEATITQTTDIPTDYKVALYCATQLDMHSNRPLYIRRITARPYVEKEVIQLKADDVEVLIKNYNSNWYLFDFSSAGTPNKTAVETAINNAISRWNHSRDKRGDMPFPSHKEFDDKPFYRHGLMMS